VAAGGLSYRELSRRAHFSVTALSEAAGGECVPSLAVALAYAEACGGDRHIWEERWRLLVAELAAAEAVVDEGEAHADVAESPYLGLATFEPGDAARFFGRERLVEELCARLAETPFLAVFGASGAGKSSVLRAGLLPAVWGGAIAGSREWLTVLLVPGERPVEELAIRLANLKGLAASSLHSALAADPDGIRLTIRQVLAGHAHPGTARVLIVVDQFEEVFTLCRDERERAGFIELLLAAAREPAARVVLGVRADFYARCAEHAALVTALRDRQVLIGPMDNDDLRSVVTGPARCAGVKVEPELVEAVVADAHDQPGALPLVSHALLETWRRRKGAALTPAGYRAAGGMRGAIAQSTERLYSALSEVQQQIAADTFLRLTALGDGTEDTRRRAPRAELLGSLDSHAVSIVLDKLIAARLVTADEDSVTVAHEALIRNWPRLRSWLAEDRELLRAHRRLTEAAAEWNQHDRDDGLLHRGARLAGWDGRALDRLNEMEAEFLAASRRRQAHERLAGRRRVRLALVSLGTAFAVVSALAGVALVQTDRTRTERNVAFSRQLAAEARSYLQTDPEQALLLARQAFVTRPTAEAEAVLRQAVADDRMLALVPGRRGRALGVAFSRDGRKLADTSVGGTVRVWKWAGDGVSGDAPVVLRGHKGEAWSPVFSPDGRRLATAGLDGTVRIWDTRGREKPVVLRGHHGPVWNVAFSPDGRRVGSAGDDGTVRIWDARGSSVKPVVLHGHEGPTVGVAFSPDGRYLASSGHDSTVRIWNASSRGAPVVLRGHEDATKSLAFSPDSTRLASASIDGTARVWPVTGKGDPVVLRGHTGTVEGVAFSPDGTRLATTSDDATVRIWNPEGGGNPLVLHGHKGTVWSAAFSADGRRLVSASEDGTVRVWDPRGSGDPVVLRGHQGATWTAAPAPDGRHVVSGGSDGTVRIWDPRGRDDPLVLRGHKGEVLGLDVSPDGKRVASAGEDGTVRVWNTTGSARPLVLSGHQKGAWSVAFSPDGKRVASVDGAGALRIWPTSGDRPVPLVRHADQGVFRSVAFSPDGRHVATAGTDSTVRIWDITRNRAPLVLRGHRGMVWAVAFSPDGRRVVSSGSDGTVRIWDTAGTTDPLVQSGHQGFVWNVAFSPDGQWVAGAGRDGTVRIWQSTAVGESLAFGGFGASVESVEFGPDSRQLITAHGDGTIRLWQCDVCRPIDQVLRLANQRVTEKR